MKRFPLLLPLVFFALPPKLATTLPTLLRSNLKPAPSDDFFVAQANHLIVGGFDPGTNLLTAATHYLLENPQTYDRLRNEVRSRFSSWDQMSNDAIQKLSYLYAVIEETLRCTQTRRSDSRVSVQETRSMVITLPKE